MHGFLNDFEDKVGLCYGTLKPRSLISFTKFNIMFITHFSIKDYNHLMITKQRKDETLENVFQQIQQEDPSGWLFWQLGYRCSILRTQSIHTLI